MIDAASDVSPPRAGFWGERTVFPQLGPRTEERETFTRLLGLPMKGAWKGCEMQRYGRAAVEVIIGDYCREWLYIDDDGVRLSKTALEYDPTQVIRWKYACEVEGPDAPDPLEAACLPIPCSASELAAFMLSGTGEMLVTVYGGWEDGPYQSMLDGMGILANKAREALRAAYQAYREAVAIVGKLDENLELQRCQLADEFEQMNGEANTREGVFAPDISREEARARRERASASVQDLRERSDQADAAFQKAFLDWRQEMVNQLLYPELPPQEAQIGPMVIALPAGTKQVLVTDIPTLIAVAKYPRMLAERRLPRGAQALPEDANARRKNVHLYRLEREHAAELNLVIARGIRGEAGGLPVYSCLDGRRCESLEQAHDCYVEIDGFKSHVLNTFSGRLEVRVDDELALSVANSELASGRIAASHEPAPLATGHMAFSFAGLRNWDEEQWKKALGKRAKWLAACIAIPGVQGVSAAFWNPVFIGAALIRAGHAKPNSVRAKFQTVHLLKPWTETWKTYEADNFGNE